MNLPILLSALNSLMSTVKLSDQTTTMSGIVQNVTVELTNNLTSPFEVSPEFIDTRMDKINDIPTNTQSMGISSINSRLAHLTGIPNVIPKHFGVSPAYSDNTTVDYTSREDMNLNTVNNHINQRVQSSGATLPNEKLLRERQLRRACGAAIQTMKRFIERYVSKHLEAKSLKILTTLYKAFDFSDSPFIKDPILWL